MLHNTIGDFYGVKVLQVFTIAFLNVDPPPKPMHVRQCTVFIS